MSNTILSFTLGFFICAALSVKNNTIINQPEYNHKVTIQKVEVVSNTTQDTIHCIWYKDQIYTLDTIAMKNL